MHHFRAKTMHYIANGSQSTLGLLRHDASPISAAWQYTSILRNSSAPAKEEQEEEEMDQRKLPADYDPNNFDPAEHRSPPTDRVFRLVDEVAGLTLLEVSDLSDLLMKRIGIKEMPAIVMMKPGMAMPGMSASKPASAKEEAKPAKTSFDLKLDSYEAASKIKIIKEVRTFTDLGLKEAKELVEKTPVLLKKGVSKEEGEQIIEKLKAVGAKVVME
eukprot:Gb_16973 [translate_table: standard]